MTKNTFIMRKIYFFILALVAGTTQLFADMPGALPGRFTINENGDVVAFSKGNAQYKASSNTWRFAENQYDYIGQANKNISDNYSDWIDLFAWGTGEKPTFVSTTDYYYDSETGETTEYYEHFVDWGKNRFSNGGNTSNTWRTLTETEWDYLLTHIGTEDYTFSANFTGTVNNIYGLFIIPDNYERPAGIESDQTHFTLSEWQLLENAGMVFIPAAGLRYNKGVYRDGTRGRYWCYPRYESSRSAIMFDETEPYVFTVSDAGVDWFDDSFNLECEPCVGYSVRLVQDAEPLPPPVTPITYTITPRKYVIVASRSEGADYFYMTADLGTASTKRFQAVNSGKKSLSEVPATGLEDKYIWTVEADGENLRLRNGDQYVTWTSGNSANLNSTGKVLRFTKNEERDAYTVWFKNDSETRILSFHTSSDYFAFYTNNSNQIGYLHFLPYEDGEPVDPVDPPQQQSDNLVILAQRNASSDWFYMTSDLTTTSTKRYQAVDAGTNDVNQVVTTGLDAKYYWQIEGSKLHTAAGYSTWSTGNSAKLDNTGLDLTIRQENGFYTFSFADGSDTRYLSMNTTAGNDYFAYYKGTGQIYKLKVLHEGDNTIPQALNPIDASSLKGEDQGRLILRNGQLLILRGDKTYTLQGQEVK